MVEIDILYERKLILVRVQNFDPAGSTKLSLYAGALQSYVHHILNQGDQGLEKGYVIRDVLWSEIES